MRDRAEVARLGEDLAAEHLRARGVVLLARNWRPAGGEIRGELDLVGRAGGVLVVCEVKTRRSAEPDAPLWAVTQRKQARLRRLAACFLHEAGIRPDGVRFDVIGVRLLRAGAPDLLHLEGAF